MMDQEKRAHPRWGLRLAILALVWIGVVIVPRMVAGWIDRTGITLPLAEPSLGHVAYDILTDIDQANAWAKEGRPLPPWTRVTVNIAPSKHDPRATTLSGTAFALARSSGTTVWATNQHMVGPCTRSLSVRFTGREQGASVTMSDEPNDLALMWAADTGPEPLPVSERLPNLGEEAYLYGYPHAKPGAVAGRLLARAKVRHLSS